MIAPAHIRGKIGRHAPEHLRQERLQWVRDNADLPARQSYAQWQSDAPFTRKKEKTA